MFNLHSISETTNGRIDVLGTSFANRKNKNIRMQTQKEKKKEKMKKIRIEELKKTKMI